ncbi:MAG: sulfhydrogenase subunit delta [Gammaproteobacteria bacterium]|nr:sulfhydrogenase subunit delta [Gammaproteobacteria bacterium]
MQQKPRLAVHKFSSCDGCQLAILNMGDKLIQLAKLVDIVHFVEAGVVNENAMADIALVEGSISTAHDLQRIQRVRENSKMLVSIGACATSGGLQALRNIYDDGQWLGELYASPQYIDSLKTSAAINESVKVDFELWGCPISSDQIIALVAGVLHGARPRQDKQNVCMECKRQQNNCVMVAMKIPCMGAVTHNGCGALCPSFGRDCYGCYGPAEHINTDALSQRFAGLGLTNLQRRHRFHLIHSHSADFRQAGERADHD